MLIVSNTLAELGNKLDMRLDARREYESRVASKARVLDIGGHNKLSRSARRLRELGTNPRTEVVCTDILEVYKPDIVDDICRTSIRPGAFDGIYCDAILEHVTEYWNAIRSIHSILIPGGEAFIFVPFFWVQHDNMDYHRFTVTEVARMLEGFSEVKIFLPEKYSGYGYVLWSLLTFGRINSFPRLHASLATSTNLLLKSALWLSHLRRRLRGRRSSSFKDEEFYFTYIHCNHGFCAWVKK